MIDLTQIPTLSAGEHERLEDGACLLEAVSSVAGEPWSDHPVCVCPVLSTLLRSWNDNLPDSERDTLLRPLIPRLIGTRGSQALEQRRAIMAADWLVRFHTPAWLRLAGLTVHAEALASLPEITDFAQFPPLMPLPTATQKHAYEAWAAAMEAAWAASRDAAWVTTRDASWDAAWAAAWAIAWEEAWDADRVTAWVVTRDAAWALARAADRAAARDVRISTQKAMQQSALALVDRMILATDETDAGAATRSQSK
jgi:hypothetical protein